MPPPARMRDTVFPVGRHKVSPSQMVGCRPAVPSGIKTCHERNPHWMELCQQASAEQDHEKLLELINEINRLLDDKGQRLRPAPPKTENAR